MLSNPISCSSPPRPAPIWSAPSSELAEPLTQSSDTSERSTSYSITRRVWVVQHRGGWYLDAQGVWTDRLEWAWWPLDPHAAAKRLQHLNIDLSICRLVPMTLTTHPSIPWKWRANG